MVNLGREEVRIVNDLRLVVALHLILRSVQILERRHRPQANSSVQASREQPAAVRVESDSQGGLFVALAAKHGNTWLAFEFGMEVPETDGVVFRGGRYEI